MLDPTIAISVNRPIVASETQNGEAVIMHHGTGRYFDTVGSGALIWQAIEGVTTIDRIAGMLAATYGLDASHAKGVAERFVGTAAEHGLVEFGRQTLGPVVAGQANGAFDEPVLSVHEDLADMLLLDPIHDVDEAGWPAPRQAGSA